MKFVEDTGSKWTAVQIRAVEMEIEQQKREWEEKRLAQQQLEDLERQRSEKEDNEILTYSREDAHNKVNIRSKSKSQVLSKRKSESLNHSPKLVAQGKKSNGTEVIQNGTVKSGKGNGLATSPKLFESPMRRNTRNASSRSVTDEGIGRKTLNKRSASTCIPQRGTSRKSDRSTSMHSRKSQARSTSESTSRSAADSISQRTATHSATTPDETDSECSLDVMIDSNDVNDSDSNSLQNATCANARSRFDSASHDDETLLNEDSIMTDDTTVEKFPKNTKETADDKITSSPRTRSRGTVNVNLWTLDESPILPSKRQKFSVSKASLNSPFKVDKELKANFGVKECKVSVVDINSKQKKPTPMLKSSLISRQKRSTLSTTNNHTLESWIKKPQLLKKNTLSPQEDDKRDTEKVPVTRQRRNTILMHKTL